MSNLSSQFRQHTAAEVDQMTEEQAMNTRVRAAGAQRAEPESAMDAYQHTIGGGVFGNALEHVGDLTHRMNKNPQYMDTTLGDTVPKIDRMDGLLNSKYGFEREMGENLVGNASYHGQSYAEHVGQHNELSENYSAAHERLPVYNYPSEVARGAAVALGREDMAGARAGLSTLSAMHHGGRDSSGEGWAEGDLGGLLEPGKQNMVDYLRGHEARTPAITNAATAMLGGRIRR